MKRKLLILSLLFINIIFSQETKTIKFNPKIKLGITTQKFFGDNYLAKGHKNPAIGLETSFQVISIKKFNIGLGFNKSFINVSDKSIGGNIDKTNINSINGFISYDLLKLNKFNFKPEIQFGGLEIRQKNGNKLYGVQNGNFYNFSIQISYDYSKHFNPYFKLGYTNYFLNTNTSEEFKNYFNHSSSLNLSLGIQFL